MEWFKTTLQTYPAIAIFLSLCIGYWAGGKTFKGFSLGAVTATLLAAIVIGQLEIKVADDVKNVFFLMFLFAVGYGIGPQFVKGIAKDGLPQAIFALVQCCLCLIFPIIAAKIAGYDLGAATGLYAGSQTISASMGMATDAISRLGLSAAENSAIQSSMPVAYAVTYIFGTVGSAILLSQVLPVIMRVNLFEACKDYEQKHGMVKDDNSSGTAWHEYELRAYKISGEACAGGETLRQFEEKFPGRKVFVEGVRRDGKIIALSQDTEIMPGDVLAIGGNHAAVVELFSHANCYDEVEDVELLSQPVTGVDVYICRKTVEGKTLHELARLGNAHGVFLRGIRRGPTGTEIPIMPQTKLLRGDVVTLSGLTKDVERAAKAIGVVDKKTNISDVAFIGGAITVGALIGAIVIHIGGVPITLSTAGGSLVAGLVFGWIRSFHPTFGRIPDSTVWFMNSVGLNVFIAVVGLTAGPNFVAGLQELGISLFLWGIFSTSLPLVCGAMIGRYVFKFHPAILFGCCAGARTTTAALGMVSEKAKSNIPGLGYTITYAVGNTFLTIWGMVLIMILS